MEEEFTRSTGWKIFYSAASGGFALFMIILFVNHPSKTVSLLWLIPVTTSLFAILVVASQFKNKVIIAADYIVRITVFGKKELLTANVKGYRIGQRFVAIEPVSAAYSKIVINNYDDFSDSEDLIKWIKDNFTDLNAADLKREREKLLQNTSLGLTEKEREEKLKKAKIWAIGYNVIGAILTFSVIFFDNYFSACLMIAFPLVGILLMKFNRLIKFVSESKRSIYAFIFLGFTLPAFIMLIKSINEYEIYQYKNVWLPFISIALATAFLIYLTGINDALPAKAQIITMAISCILYGYGSSIQINCMFDSSIPKLIHTSVNSKWKDYNKGAHYHLKLNSWDNDSAPKEIEVSSSVYNKYSDGDNVNVSLKQGLLNVPWYSLSI